MTGTCIVSLAADSDSPCAKIEAAGELGDGALFSADILSLIFWPHEDPALGVTKALTWVPCVPEFQEV